jgi:hypothetical protein
VISGVLHSAGSFTTPGPSNPITGSFVFFAIQPIGIMAEKVGTQLVNRTSLSRRVPKRFGQLFRFVYVHAWFYFTAPLLCDDFARQGLWLYEPVPVSPIRALGFGVKGDSWWCWSGPLVHWHNDETWWKSGFYL